MDVYEVCADALSSSMIGMCLPLPAPATSYLTLSLHISMNLLNSKPLVESPIMKTGPSKESVNNQSQLPS